MDRCVCVCKKWLDFIENNDVILFLAYMGTGAAGVFFFIYFDN